MPMVTDRTGLRRFEAIKPRGIARVQNPSPTALLEGRTIFPSRVYDPATLDRLLVSGMNSRKIGAKVQKGRWRGFPIFTLTLEERATCPRTCAEWRTCYGNNMNWARRIKHGAAFEQRLWTELALKQATHPAGFVVRLHVLGDFYSADYAELWAEAMDAFPALRVFGYTAHDPESDVGIVLAGIIGDHPSRFAFRFSGLEAERYGAVVVSSVDTAGYLVCPAQRDLTDCCATCAICWQSDRTIAFVRH